MEQESNRQNEYHPLTDRRGHPFQHKFILCLGVCSILFGQNWVTIQPVKLRMKSTPPELYGLRVWEGRFPKGKLKCFYQKKRQMLSRRKKKKKKPWSTLRRLLLTMPVTSRVKSHLIAFQTISSFCCHSLPFPHPFIIDRAPVQPQKVS